MEISVVIPLYNKARYLRRALTSVLGQSAQPIEIIIVDDGSTDGGTAGIEECSHPLVQVIRQENAGPSAARNQGIKRAKADWIAFLDADDEWHPSFLENCLQVIEKHVDVVGVFTNFGRGSFERPVLQSRWDAPVVLDNYFAFAVENRGLAMWSSAVTISRKHLLAVGGFPDHIRHGEDIDTWTRLALRGKIAYVPAVLAIYHEVPGSLSQSAQPEFWWQPDLYASEVGAKGRDALTYLKLWNRPYARALLATGNRHGAREVLLKRCSPFPNVMAFLVLLGSTLLPSRMYRQLRRVRRIIRRWRFSSEARKASEVRLSN